MPLSNLLPVFGVLIGTILFYATLVTYRHRSHINNLRKQGFPMPKNWSWITGHILVLYKYQKRFPPSANVALTTQELCREFPDTEMFLLDLWPAFPTSLMVFNPEAAVLISQKYNLPKSDASLELLKPIVGGHSLISMNGIEWKIWRARLNPGFSSATLMQHVPFIVDCMEVFCGKLRRMEGRIFLLDDFATRLTFDVIMKISLDSDINYQLSEHILPNAVNTITRWHSFWDIRVLMNPLRPIIQRYYGKVLQRYIRKELNARFAEVKKERFSLSPPDVGTKGPSSAISLAIDAFFQEKKNEEVSETMELDEDFAAIVSHQIRLFLFAGTDTTSSTLAFVYHLISKHPEVVSRLREEHNQVFGPDPSSVSGLLKAKPTLLNQCPYTLAVIKETLRIYPPATNLRQGTTGVSLPALNGQLLPTEGLFIIINHQAIHQNPRIWKQANEFLPERWLVPSDHDLYPPAGAYRPFDIGSRACIGQTLSLIEMRIALVMTCRTFDLRPAYGEWDRIRARDAGWWRRIGGMMGFGRGEMKEVRGDRAYQTEKAGTHPSDGYPCRVSVLGGGGL